jgi:NADPH-dependent ferric siderophore reductase
MSAIAGLLPDAITEKLRSKLLVRQCRVIGIKSHSRNMVEIQVEFVDGRSQLIPPGSHVAVALGGPTKSPLGAWRRYTVISADQPRGERDTIRWLVFVNGERPGARFHRQLQVGGLLSVRVGNSDSAIDALLQRCDQEQSNILCIGDETAIGMFAFLFESRSRSSLLDAKALLLVGDDHDAAIPGFTTTQLGKFRSLPALLAALDNELAHQTNVCVFVVGGKPLVGLARSRVRAAGISSNNIASRVYWAPGKVGPE